jgi:hypothetical protein
LATVPCDEAFPEVMADVIQSYRHGNEYGEPGSLADPFFTAAATVGLASWRSSAAYATSAVAD